MIKFKELQFDSNLDTCLERQIENIQQCP